jgi:hypothetical protein
VATARAAVPKSPAAGPPGASARADSLLLRAAGAWHEGDALRVFSRTAGLPAPQQRVDRRLWRRAPEYRRLRTQPRGATLAAAVLTGVVLAGCVLGAAAGVSLTRLLPQSFGAVRALAGAVAAVAGVVAGLVIVVTVVAWATSALKWIARRPIRRSAVIGTPQRTPVASRSSTTPRIPPRRRWTSN